MKDDLNNEQEFKAIKRARRLLAIYTLLIAGFLISSCHSQVSTALPKEKADTINKATVIIGSPPPIVIQTGIPTDSFLVSQYIRTIFHDTKRNYWFGPAGQSVARYRNDTLTYFSKDDFFEGNQHVSLEYGNSVHAIAEDHHGNIWFGTDIGVIKYDGKRFRSYSHEHGLSNIRVGRKCILTDKAGNVWIGTDDGVYQYDPFADSAGAPCFSLFNLLPAIHVKDIIQDREGNIWFASEDQGVFRYNPSIGASGKAITNYNQKDGLGDNYAGGIIQDKEGNFWFTMKGGVCRYHAENQTFTELTTKDGLGGSEIWGIYAEQSGFIWITARGSTTRYDPAFDISDPKAFKVFTSEDGINCCVQSMHEDRSGNMWWGAGAGLYRFDGKRFYQVKQQGPWHN